MEKITIEKKITTVETVKVDIELPVYLKYSDGIYVWIKEEGKVYIVTPHYSHETSGFTEHYIDQPAFTPSTREEFLAAVAKYKANVLEFCKKMKGELSETNLTIK